MNKYADQWNHKLPGRTAETWNSQSTEKIKDLDSCVDSNDELSHPGCSFHNKLSASEEENIFRKVNGLCLWGPQAKS